MRTELLGIIVTLMALLGATATARAQDSANPIAQNVRAAAQSNRAIFTSLRDRLVNQSGRPDFTLLEGRACDSYPAVGALRRNGAMHCTGTVIGGDGAWVLTAGHCTHGVPASELVFVVGPDARNAIARYQVIESRVYDGSLPGLPAYDPAGHGVGDLAVLRLAMPVAGVRPLGVVRTPVTTGQTDNLHFIGYGYAATASDAGRTLDGRKRCGDIAVHYDAATLFRYQMRGRNTCNGDSGGPALTDDGLIAGVTSYGDERCEVDGHDVRTDAYVAWIDRVVGGNGAVPGDVVAERVGGDDYAARYAAESAQVRSLRARVAELEPAAGNASLGRVMLAIANVGAAAVGFGLVANNLRILNETPDHLCVTMTGVGRTCVLNSAVSRFDAARIAGGVSLSISTSSTAASMIWDGNPSSTLSFSLGIGGSLLVLAELAFSMGGGFDVSAQRDSHEVLVGLGAVSLAYAIATPIVVHFASRGAARPANRARLYVSPFGVSGTF